MIAAINGGRIGYDDSGSSGPAVVLLHGYPVDRSAWDPVMPAVVASGARVIRLDLRGCGESAASVGPARMEVLADDVAALLDVLGIDRAAVAGSSIGSYAGFAFARQYPERVNGFALLAGHAAADAHETPVQRELAASRAAMADRLEREGTMDAAVESYLPKYLAPHRYGDDPAMVEALRSLMQRQDARGCAQLQRGMALRTAGFDLLPAIRVPALVLAGEDDVYLRPADLRATAEAMGRPATFVTLPRVGHLPSWEAPAETAAALIGWLREIR